MGDEPQGQDVVELGQRRVRLPRLPGFFGWRPSRGTAIVAAVALAVGLGAGFAAGGSGTFSLSGRTVSPAASPTAAGAHPFAGGPTVSQDTTTACSAQTGPDLELGVQVTNQSAVTVVLESARSVLPVGGLKQVSWQWGPCGTLPGGPGQAEEIIPPGQSTWLTATFTVERPCPAASSVQFAVAYVVNGHSVTAALPGFPDLSQVPYKGCPSTADSTSGGQLGPAARWREPVTG